MTEKIPPWVDMEMLCWAICTCPTSVENYVVAIVGLIASQILSLSLPLLSLARQFQNNFAGRTADARRQFRNSNKGDYPFTEAPAPLVGVSKIVGPAKQ
jgi:hypothetical protein